MCCLFVVGGVDAPVFQLIGKPDVSFLTGTQMKNQPLVHVLGSASRKLTGIDRFGYSESLLLGNPGMSPS